VTHRHFAVNGRVVDIPSYRLKPGDVVSVREKSRKLQPIAEALAERAGNSPEWLEVDTTQYTVTIKALPTREQIDTDVREQQVIEFYAR